jgi:xanthine dehydrogenase iron-sulfur cluster and FAD-binding subunit A
VGHPGRGWLLRVRAADYELVSPATLKGVLELMAAEPGQWMPIAGGTELMVQFAAGRLQAKKLVNIFGLAELQGIAETPKGVVLGAGTTYTVLRRSAIVARGFPLLARAASWTAGGGFSTGITGVRGGVGTGERAWNSVGAIRGLPYGLQEECARDG